MTAFIMLSGFLAAAAPAPVYIVCDYYDFAHDITYRSRLFEKDDAVSPNGHDVPDLTAPFGQAITAAYHVTPDPKHIECLIVGPVSLPAAKAKDADMSLWDASERKVDWPAQDAP